MGTHCPPGLAARASQSQVSVTQHVVGWTPKCHFVAGPLQPPSGIPRPRGWGNPKVGLESCQSHCCVGFRGLKLIKELPGFHFSYLPAIYMLIGLPPRGSKVSAPGGHHAETQGEAVHVLTLRPWTAEAEADTSPSQGSGF